MPIAVMPIAKGQHGAYQLTLRPARASASKTLARRDALLTQRAVHRGQRWHLYYSFIAHRCGECQVAAADG